MDPEIVAMGEVAKVLEPLDDDATSRVLRWALARFQKRLHGTIALDVSRPSDAGQLPAASMAVASSSSSGSASVFTDFPALFDAANPQTGLDRVLLGGYWFQVVLGQEDWDSQTVNTELKNMGHPSGNITRDVDALIKRTPRLVLQVRKDGTSRQARKRFKLTREGIRAVQSMMNVSGGGSPE